LFADTVILYDQSVRRSMSARIRSTTDTLPACRSTNTPVRSSDCNMTSFVLGVTLASVQVSEPPLSASAVAIDDDRLVLGPVLADVSSHQGCSFFWRDR
jgi:hypothetical protein